MDDVTVTVSDGSSVNIEEKINGKDVNLKHLCRETTRNHLLWLDLFTNLFGRIPHLGLPVSQSRYLMYEAAWGEI